MVYARDLDRLLPVGSRYANEGITYVIEAHWIEEYCRPGRSLAVAPSTSMSAARLSPRRTVTPDKYRCRSMNFSKFVIDSRSLPNGVDRPGRS